MTAPPKTSTPRPIPSLTSCLLAALLAGGCATGETAPAVLEPPPNPLLEPDAERFQAPAPDTFKVLFETTAGDFVVEVQRAWAPRGADRFHALVANGYYDGVRFFRVVSGFVAQFGLHGDPEVSAAWAGARIADDPVRVSNERGTLTFAMGGPDTRTVQLFLNLVDNARLDSGGFAPLGRVTGGMDTVDRIYAGYGEGAPRGDGPPQGQIREGGEAYLEAEFPALDRIRRARIL